MRINVYTEELTDDIRIVKTTAKTGKSYPAVRFMLESSDRLHNKSDDDDRTAVTFWFHDLEFAALYFARALNQIQIAIAANVGDRNLPMVDKA